MNCDFPPAMDMTLICGGDFPRLPFRIPPMRETHGIEVLDFSGEVLMYRNPTCAAMHGGTGRNPIHGFSLRISRFRICTERYDLRIVVFSQGVHFRTASHDV